MIETLPMRRAGPADAAAVRTLTRAAYAKWVPILGREPRPMTADYECAVVEHRVDLIEGGGDLQALMETIVRPEDLLIVNVAVAPAHQGRGLGRQLLVHADRLAHEADRGLVRLYTNQRMTENIALYTRSGFAVERLEAHAEFGTVVHMMRLLPREAP